MNKLIFSLIVCITISFSFVCSNANNMKRKEVEVSNQDTIKNNRNDDIYGKWKIIRFVPGKVAAITTDEANLYIGRVILLKKEIAIILNDTCKSPVYKVHNENADNYFHINYRIGRSALNIESNEIFVTSLSCNEKPIYYNNNSPDFGREIIGVDAKTIIMPLNGVFFYLEKVQN